MSKDLKSFTPAVVVSGKVGEADDSTSLGACLRRFEKGVDLSVPGYGDVPFHGWLFSFVGDGPALAEVVGTKQSFSMAMNPCNSCENAVRPLLRKRRASSLDASVLMTGSMTLGVRLSLHLGLRSAMQYTRQQDCQTRG